MNAQDDAYRLTEGELTEEHLLLIATGPDCHYYCRVALLDQPQLYTYVYHAHSTYDAEYLVAGLCLPWQRAAPLEYRTNSIKAILAYWLKCICCCQSRV